MTSQGNSGWFELVDAIGEDQAADLIKDVHPTEPPALEMSELERLEAATFAKLGLAVPKTAVEELFNDEPHSDLKNPPLAKSATRQQSRGRLWLAVSLIIGLILAAGLAAGSPEVRAQIRKAIQFLPGFASVDKPREAGRVSYVLPDSVEIPYEGGKIELRGLMIAENLAYATLTGNTGFNNRIKSFILQDAHGKSYTFAAGMVSGSWDQWIGNYYIRQSLDLTEDVSIQLEGSHTFYPIKLQPASEFNKIEDLGATDAHNGVSLTVVLRQMTDGRNKVALVGQAPAGAIIESYGLYPFDLEHPRLMDASGQELKISQESVMPNNNEFLYEPPSGKPETRLIVPSVRLKRSSKDEGIQFPVPRSGETIRVGKLYTLQGFPAKLISISRIPANEDHPNNELLSLKWDLHYNPAGPESLLAFTPDTSLDLTIGSGGYKVDEKTGVMQELYLPVPEKSKTYTIYVNEVHTLLRGPWQFLLGSPSGMNSAGLSVPEGQQPSGYSQP